MELKTFVSETLTQILDGIREAQGRPGGEDVGAEGYYGQDPQITNNGDHGFFTSVKFDISVVAETKEGGSSIKVAEMQRDDGTTKTAQQANRVQFGVHIRLPKGGDRRGRQSVQGRVRTDYDVFDNDGF